MTSTPGVGVVDLTPDQLTAMANRCEDTGQSLATGMAQLIQRIESMPGAGAAFGALQTQSQTLNDGMRKIVNALDALAGKISNASGRFGVQDGDAAATINKAAMSTGDTSVMSILNGNG
jgi:WXG100 family type VII secretion target